VAAPAPPARPVTRHGRARRICRGLGRQVTGCFGAAGSP